MSASDQSTTNIQTGANHPTVAQLRHRAEIPMLALAGLLTLVALGAAGWAVSKGSEIPGWTIPALIGLSVPLIAGIVIIRYQYWKEISNGVEINEHQFPEIFQSYKAIATNMGISYLPRLYLKNGDGGLNAFASKCQVRRTYVVIFSDLLDIAYEHGDFDGINFVLAHELGHIKCGHVDLWRLAITSIPRTLFLGRSVSRAQEYTAYRCAAYYAPQGAKSMMVLYAGKRQYQRTDITAYLNSVHDHKDGFWLKFSNFMSTHAVGFRRIEPLCSIEQTGWDVHGKML